MSDDAQKLRDALGSIGYAPPPQDRTTDQEIHAFRSELAKQGPIAGPALGVGAPARPAPVQLPPTQVVQPYNPTLPPPRPPAPGTMEPDGNGGWQRTNPGTGPGVYGTAGQLPPPARPTPEQMAAFKTALLSDQHCDCKEKA